MEHSTLEKATAYHEAGHAVAARLVRMRFPL
jgi:ATP-dependent Zn protease